MQKDVNNFINDIVKPFDYDDTVFKIEGHCLRYIGNGGRVLIPDGAYSLQGMFKDCNLDILILDSDTSKVLNMSSMFENAKINNLKLGSKFSTCSARNMNYMFKNAKIANMDMIKGFNTSNLRSMNHMFENCPIPSGFIIGNEFDLTMLKEMNYTFYHSEFPEDFTLRDIYVTKNTYIEAEYTFSYTKLPKGFEIGNSRSKRIIFSTYEGKYPAFAYCTIPDGFRSSFVYYSSTGRSCYSRCNLADDFTFPEGFELYNRTKGESDYTFSYRGYEYSVWCLDSLFEDKEQARKFELEEAEQELREKQQKRKTDLEEQCKKELLKLLKEGKTISEARQSLLSSGIDLSGHSQHDFKEILDSAVIFISEALTRNCKTDISNLLSFKSNNKYSKYTIGEVRDKLLAKGYPKEIVYECILNYISDQYLTL